MYNNWNFTTASQWDSVETKSFYYANKTRKMWETDIYTIGEEYIPNIVLKIKPEKIISKGMGEPNTIFGIPYSFSDKVEEFVVW